MRISPEGQEGLDAAHKLDPGLVISDIRMSEMDGFAFCKLVRGVFPEMPFIFMTGYATPEIQKQADEMGGIEVMMKPFPLVAVLEETIKKLTQEK